MAAAAVGALAAVPQVYKTASTNDTRAISGQSVGLQAASSTMWLVYGWHMHLAPTVLGSALGLACSLYMLAAVCLTDGECQKNHR